MTTGWLATAFFTSVMIVNAQSSETPVKIGEKPPPRLMDQPMRPPREKFRGRNPNIENLLKSKEIAKKLGITDEQRETMLRRFNAIHEKEKILFEQQEAAAVQQAKLLLQKDIDKDALFKAVEKTGAIRTEIAKLRIEKILIMREELTDEQQMKLRVYINKNRRHNREGRTHFGDGRHRAKRVANNGGPTVSEDKKTD